MGWRIFHYAGLAFCCRSRLSSNVRPHRRPRATIFSASVHSLHTFRGPPQGAHQQAIASPAPPRRIASMSLPAKKATPGALASTLRVTKKLATTSRGAIKLAQQFGDTLVCVRHRVDAQAKFRYTTVELLIEKTEMQPRQSRMVRIRVHPDEFGLRTVVRAAGAVCDSRTGLWHLPQRVATVLRLSNRIVPSK